MPQASDELRSAWRGPSDDYATGYLVGRGYELTVDWDWVHPDGIEPTDRDWSAIQFMHDEWDYGTYVKEGYVEGSEFRNEVRPAVRNGGGDGDSH